MKQRQMSLCTLLVSGIMLCNMFFFTPVSAALTFPIKYDPIIEDPTLIIDNPIIDNPLIIDDSLIREPLIVVPAAPSDLIIGATTSTEITIEWSDNSSNETGFTVERRTGSSNWSQVGRLAQMKPILPVTNFLLSGLTTSGLQHTTVQALQVIPTRYMVLPTSRLR